MRFRHAEVVAKTVRGASDVVWDPFGIHLSSSRQTHQQIVNLGVVQTLWSICICFEICLQDLKRSSDTRELVQKLSLAFDAT